MDKRRLVETIQAHLAEELATLVQAGAQAERAAGLQGQLLMWKHLPIREYGPNDVICPAALVELEFQPDKGKATRAFYFIAPQGGGLVTRVDGEPVQVITPNSPMGEALMGKKEGDLVEVETRSSMRSYRVISVR